MKIDTHYKVSKFIDGKETCYLQTITAMPQYQNASFEELRYASLHNGPSNVLGKKTYFTINVPGNFHLRVAQKDFEGTELLPLVRIFASRHRESGQAWDFLPIEVTREDA